MKQLFIVLLATMAMVAGVQLGLWLTRDNHPVDNTEMTGAVDSAGDLDGNGLP